MTNIPVGFPTYQRLVSVHEFKYTGSCTAPQNYKTLLSLSDQTELEAITQHSILVTTTKSQIYGENEVSALGPRSSKMGNPKLKSRYP